MYLHMAVGTAFSAGNLTLPLMQVLVARPDSNRHLAGMQPAAILHTAISNATAVESGHQAAFRDLSLLSKCHSRGGTALTCACQGMRAGTLGCAEVGPAPPHMEKLDILHGLPAAAINQHLGYHVAGHATTLPLDPQ